MRLLGFLALPIAAWLALLAGCDIAPGVHLEAGDAGLARDAEAPPPRSSVLTPDYLAGAQRAASEAAVEETAPQPAADRLLIRSAEFGIEVPDVEAAIAACTEQVTALQGYVSRRDGPTLVCRVPAASFAAFVDKVRALGRVLRESMQVADVTDQHRDLAIRLENAKHARDRLLALLERADKVEDILKIEAELRRLTEEIERMTAQLKSLDERIALSTVTVVFATPTPVPIPVERRPSRFPWINRVGAEHVLRQF